MAAKFARWVLYSTAALCLFSGCATNRVTDPYQTATEQFLQSEATREAVSRITSDQLRDRKVFVDGSYLSVVKESNQAISYTETPPVNLFLLAELRAKLMMAGARLVDKREDAQIVVEVRTGGIGVDHQEFLLGIPNIALSVGTAASSVPIQTPEVAILKSTKQFGFASVACVAYWRDTGEIVNNSGPFVGRTRRQDVWYFGLGPVTTGNIPPAQGDGK